MNTLFSRLPLVSGGFKHYRVIKDIAKQSHSSFKNLLLASEGDLTILKNTHKMVHLIPREAYENIYRQYKDADPYPGYSKYLESSVHIARAIKNAKKLGLTETSTLDILDIGSGAGYFPFVCQNYGHKTLAIDLAENKMYRDMKKLLGVECVTHRVEAFQLLPDLGRKFDLISGFQILFDRTENQKAWEESEWIFFLNDLSKRLKRGGKLYFGLNTFEPENRKILKENLMFFKKIGATVVGQDVYFQDVSLIDL